MEYQLVEVSKGIRFPVGSIVHINGEKTYYRNITERHIFSKGDYKALAIDDVVVKWLTENDKGVLTVRFDAGAVTYKTALQAFTQAHAKRMNGREQRFVSIERFDKEQPTHAKRPTEKREVIVE